MPGLRPDGMSGLLLILSETEGERFTAAIELAAATAALGRPVTLHLRGPAVTRLHLPAVAEALTLLTDLGATLTACQTALATHDIPAITLPEGIEPTGLIALLTPRADWQLLLA
jgi:intracellular sulfur oxidation DsrE/DsrF family protein